MRVYPFPSEVNTRTRRYGTPLTFCTVYSSRKKVLGGGGGHALHIDGQSASTVGLPHVDSSMTITKRIIQLIAVTKSSTVINPLHWILCNTFLSDGRRRRHHPKIQCKNVGHTPVDAVGGLSAGEGGSVLRSGVSLYGRIGRSEPNMRTSRTVVDVGRFRSFPIDAAVVGAHGTSRRVFRL